MKIAVINDLSGMGRCSLVASISVLSVLGQQVFPVPTAILSNQTGYPQFSFVDFTDNMDEYLANWQSMGTKFDVIYSGFLSNCSQVKKIEKMRDSMGHENTLLVVDPVMGDGGQKYATFSDELCNEVKTLATMADVVTPNVTEACLLTGIDYNEFIKETNLSNFEQRFFDLATKVSLLGPQKVVITGWENDEKTKQVYNFVFDNGEFNYTKNDMFGGHYSGTGDIMASIITGKIACGKSLFGATKTAADFVAIAVKDAFQCGVDKNDGVNFEKFLQLLVERQK